MAVLRFPGMGGPARKAAAPAPTAAPPPAVDSFDAQKAKTLGAILERAVERSKVLTDLLRDDRELAALAGIEGIAIEIQALLESDRFGRVRDALGEAVRLAEGATVTHEGLAKLHRLEALVSEGTQTLGRSSVQGPSLGSRRLSQAGSSNDLILYGAIFMLGAVALTLAACLMGQRAPGTPTPYLQDRPEVPMGIPSRVPPKKKKPPSPVEA
jgi:hypothetical protein